MNAAGQFGRFEILLAQRRLQVDGRPVALGSRAFDLLAALVARRDRVVPKGELIDVVWPGLVVEDNNLQVQISALRRALGVKAIATVPGRGYQFTVGAVAAGGEAAGSRGPEKADAAARRRSRLLVADDNKVNRLLLCRSLDLMGHDVVSADNGRAALEALRGGGIDLLLLDLEMPEIDGFALLEQRAADPAWREVPVIVTSSVEGVAPVARCLELGADDYLHKPVNPVLLKARVDSSLERKHLRDRERELLARLAPDRGDARPAFAGPATLLTARLREFDETAPAQETLELLSAWATLMVDAVEAAGGVVSAMRGDALTGLFDAGGALQRGGDDAEALAAVQAALEMVELVGLFNQERALAGKAPVALSVGIASGLVVSGYAGTPRCVAPVCVGAAVQSASALEAVAAEQGVPVLLDGATQGALAGRVATAALSPATVPGPETAAPVYALALARVRPL